MTSPGLEPTPKREFDVEVEKCLYTSDSGAQFLSVHARLLGTSLYTISHRNVLDVPVHLLTDIADNDWSDPLLQEMRREALDDIECQAHVIARAFGIGTEPRPSWQDQQAEHLRAVEAALGIGMAG